MDFLRQFDYTDDEIGSFMRSYNENIIQRLTKYSYNVVENMRYLQPHFDKELLIKLIIFYDLSFEMDPGVFEDGIMLLRNAFPEDWDDIIRKQFWGYDGRWGTNYKPYLEYMGDSYGMETVLINAIDQLKNPQNTIFEFMLLLSEEGIEISGRDFEHEVLWDMELSKYEIVDNAKSLLEKGLSTDTILSMIYINPYMFMLSTQSLLESLIKNFGEDYIEELENRLFEEEIIDILTTM